MRYYLNLDPDGYVLSVSKTNTGGPVVKKLDGLDLSGRRIQAHRWDGKKLILDEEKLAQIEAEERAEEPPGEEPETGTSGTGDAVSWDALAEAIREGVDSV